MADVVIKALIPTKPPLDVDALQKETNLLLAESARLIAEAKVRLEELRQSCAVREALLERRRRS